MSTSQKKPPAPPAAAAPTPDTPPGWTEVLDERDKRVEALQQARETAAGATAAYGPSADAILLFEGLSDSQLAAVDEALKEASDRSQSDGDPADGARD